METLPFIPSISAEDVIKSAADCVKASFIMQETDSSAEKSLHSGKIQTDTVCPAFPISVFPSTIQTIAHAYHQYEGFNMDYLCVSMLTVFASAMGNQWTARFSTSWTTAPILYVVLIGPASCGKTPPLRQITEPLRKFDRTLDIVYNEELKKYQQAMELSKEQRLANGFDEFPVRPIHRQIIVINSTIESLFVTIAQNRRGVLMNVDELDSLTGNMSRYTNGSDETYWLEMFNGSQVKYARKSTGEYINIAHPYVSVIGGTQPGILSSMFGGKREANGFASRFLKVFPDIEDMPGWSVEQMPERFVTGWEDIISQVLSVKSEITQDGDIASRTMEFTPEARQRLIQWKNTVNGQIWRDTDSEYIKGVCGKLETYIIRLCLILQIMKTVCDGADDGKIDADCVEKAILLTEYFRAMDLRAFNYISHQPIDSLHQKIYDKLPDAFTTAEAVALGELLGTSESTVKRFLRDGVAQKYLKKYRHGSYSKQDSSSA